jgi:hypothetical protein
MGFSKRLPMCDPYLGPTFLQEVHVHYDMNPELNMLTKIVNVNVYLC